MNKQLIFFNPVKTIDTIDKIGYKRNIGTCHG